MLDQLAIARRIVEDGDEVVPAWRIETPEGAFLVLTLSVVFFNFIADLLYFKLDPRITE